MARCSYRIRSMANDLEAPPPLRRGRNMRQDPGRPPDSRTLPRPRRLDRVSGLDYLPRPSTRNEPHARHTGICRITRICGPNPLTTRSATHAADSARRFTSSTTEMDDPSSADRTRSRRGFSGVPTTDERTVRAANRARQVSDATGCGARRQGILVESQPSSSAITAHRGSDRRTGQPEM